MASAGTVTIDFAANIARLEAATKGVSKSVRAMHDDVRRSLGSLRNVALGLGAVLGVHSLTGWVRGASEAADAAAKMGDRFGIATEELIGMNHAAELAGGSAASITNGMRTMTRALTDAIQKGGEFTSYFQQLGIETKEFSALPVDQQLTTIIDRLGQVNNAALRNALGMQLLGRGYGELAGLVAEGSGVIREAVEDTKAWGSAISRVDAAKLEIANDSMTRAKEASKGLATTISLALAPAVYAISKSFTDAARENNGFRDQVREGMRTAVQAVGYLANTIQGLKFFWVGLKYTVAIVAWGIIESLKWIDKAYVDLMNTMADSWIGKKLGMEQRKYSETLDNMAEATSNTADEIKKELDAIAGEGLPADKIIATYDKFVKIVNVKAAEIAEARKKMMGQGEQISDFGKSRDNEWAKWSKSYYASLDARIAKLRDSLITEQEVENNAHTNNLATLVAALEEQRMTEAQYNALREQEELRHQAAMGDLHAQGVLERQRIEQMTLTQQADFYFTTLANVTAQAAQHNKAMFRINQLAGIANAVVSANVGATKALEWGWPLGPIFAGIIWAAAAVNIAAIRRAQFGGTTSAPSISAGGAVPVTNVGSTGSAAPTTSAQPVNPVPSVTFIIQGNVIGNQDFVDNVMIPALADAFDRDFAPIRSTSRQAQILTEGTD